MVRDFYGHVCGEIIAIKLWHTAVRVKYRLNGTGIKKKNPSKTRVCLNVSKNKQVTYWGSCGIMWSGCFFQPLWVCHMGIHAVFDSNYYYYYYNYNRHVLTSQCNNLATIYMVLLLNLKSTACAAGVICIFLSIFTPDDKQKHFRFTLLRLLYLYDLLRCWCKTISWSS